MMLRAVNLSRNNIRIRRSVEIGSDRRRDAELIEVVFQDKTNLD